MKHHTVTNSQVFFKKLIFIRCKYADLETVDRRSVTLALVVGSRDHLHHANVLVCFE